MRESEHQGDMAAKRTTFGELRLTSQKEGDLAAIAGFPVVMGYNRRGNANRTP
jgi:hypothetical protein